MKRKTKNSKSRFMFYKNDKNKLYNQLMNSQKPSYMFMIERSPSAFEVRPWRAVICGSEVEEIGSSQHLKVVLVPCPRCSEFPLEECLIRERPEVGEWSLAQMEISACVACCGGRIYRLLAVRSWCGKFAGYDDRYPALSGLDMGSITYLELHKRFCPSIIEFGELPLMVPELLTSI